MAWQHNESTDHACYAGELRADLGRLRRCEVLGMRLSELRFGNRGYRLASADVSRSR